MYAGEVDKLTDTEEDPSSVKFSVGMARHSSLEKEAVTIDMLVCLCDLAVDCYHRTPVY